MIQVEICICEEEDSCFEHYVYCDSIDEAIAELISLKERID